MHKSVIHNFDSGITQCLYLHFMTRTHCLWHVYIVYDTYTLSMTRTHCLYIFVVCDWHPCLNGGTCVVDEIGYHCECTDCYTGSCCNVTVPSCNGNGGNGGSLPGRTCDDCHTGDYCEIRKFLRVDYCYRVLCNFHAICIQLLPFYIIIQFLCDYYAITKQIWGTSMDYFKNLWDKLFLYSAGMDHYHNHIHHVLVNTTCG